MVIYNALKFVFETVSDWQSKYTGILFNIAAVMNIFLYKYLEYNHIFANVYINGKSLFAIFVPANLYFASRIRFCLDMKNNTPVPFLC